MKRILITSVFVATILVGGVLAYAIWKPAEDFFTSGKKYFDQGEYQKATIQFTNAVQENVKNRDARYYLALSYISQKDLANAVKQLTALLDYYPDDIDANIRLGNIYLTGGSPEYFHQAEEKAKKVLEKDSKNVAALILRGNAYAGLQDLPKSQDYYEQAVGLDPKNTTALVSLGTAQTLQKNFPEAEKSFQDALQANPKDKTALVSLANYYRAIKAVDKAEAAYRNALSIYPGDRDIYPQVAIFFAQIGKFDESEKTFRNAQTLNPKDPTASLLLADVFIFRRQTAELQTLFADMKKSFPDNMDVAKKIAVTYIDEAPDKARAEVDRMLKINSKNPDALALLGQLQFNAGQDDAAVATFTSLPPNLANPQPEFVLGQIAMKKGQADAAQTHFQKSIAINGGYLPPRVGLAETLLNKGDSAGALSEIRKVLAGQPGYIPARILLTRIELVQKNFTDAEKDLLALQKDAPDNAIVLRQVATLYDMRSKPAEAEKNYLRAYEIVPNSQVALQDIVQFYVRAKQFDRAIQKINSVPDDKKQIYHYELMGLVYNQAGKYKEAEAAYKMAVEKDPSKAALTLLASLYIERGQLDDGLKSLDELIKQSPNHAGAMAFKGMIYEKQGKMDDAMRSYKEAIKIDPNNFVAGNNLAYMLAEQGSDLNTALSLAQMARKSQPENPSTADTLGWVYYKLGNYLLARDQALFAVSKQPNDMVGQFHLGMIYKANKQLPEAQTALKKVAASTTDFKEKPLAQAALKEISAK